MAKLELFLLGSPHIYVDGQEITDFNTRKDRALLVYLAVTGTIHSREALAGLLWSDLPEDKARRNLRHTLSHLQKVIGPQWLELERGVALTQQQPWSVDIHTLRTTIKNLTASPTSSPGHTDTQALALLNEVLNLYRGEFLQGFYLQQAAYFEEWVLAQREEARLLMLRGLETWAERSLTHGAYEIGLTATHRWLQLEPWAEPAHCLQMHLLMRSGRRGAALAQYEICRQVLAAELGVTPLPATTALYQQMKAGQYTWPASPSQSAAPELTKLPDPPASTFVATSPVPPNNLIAGLAGFVGRQSPLDFISQRLDSADCRLLTVVGLGGIGKTALALAAGQQLLRAQPTAFPDGIFWVPLVDIRTSDLADFTQPVTNEMAAGESILRAIATQIGYKLEAGVSSAVQLQIYLRARRLLLILDNFEHLLAGSDAVVTLLTKAPQVKMLLTSRARLNVRGETVLALDQLSLPTTAYYTAIETSRANPTYVIPDHVWQASEAVSMFVQRAQQFDPAFTINVATSGAVGQICQLVEGLPLGIELAASMLPLLNCTQLAQELTQSLDFLTTDMRDMPSEQRTLSAVFERSWQLLPPTGQLLLARLSIFPGSFRHAAAEQIVGATSPLLRRLLDQSLLSKLGEDRYVMHRTVHAFAQQKLQRWPEQVATLHVQYAHFYLTLLAGTEQGLTGAACAVVTAQIQADLDNVRMAWQRAVDYKMVAALRQCVNAFFLFYEQQGFYLESINLCAHALHQFLPIYEAQSNKFDTEITWLVGRLQTCFGAWNNRLGRFQQGQAAYESSVTILKQINNPVALATCLLQGGAWLTRSNPQRAAELQTEALRLIQTSNLVWLQALISQALGETIFLFGHYAEAEAKITTGYTLAKQSNWPRALISGHKALGLLQLALGRYQQAEDHLREAVGLARRYQYKTLGVESVLALAETLRLQDRLVEAKACLVESRQAATALGLGSLIALVSWEEGCLAEQGGEYAVAKACFTESLATLGSSPWWSHTLPTLGWALIGLNELAEAQAYFQKVITEAEAKGRRPVILDAQVGLAYIALLYNTNADTNTVGSVTKVFQHIYQQQAATQETRNRIAKLAAMLGISLHNSPLSPGFPLGFAASA